MFFLHKVNPLLKIAEKISRVGGLYPVPVKRARVKGLRTVRIDSELNAICFVHEGHFQRNASLFMDA